MAELTRAIATPDFEPDITAWRSWDASRNVCLVSLPGAAANLLGVDKTDSGSPVDLNRKGLITEKDAQKLAALNWLSIGVVGFALDELGIGVPEVLDNYFQRGHSFKDDMDLWLVDMKDLADKLESHGL